MSVRYMIGTRRPVDVDYLSFGEFDSLVREAENLSISDLESPKFLLLVAELLGAWLVGEGLPESNLEYLEIEVLGKSVEEVSLRRGRRQIRVRVPVTVREEKEGMAFLEGDVDVEVEVSGGWRASIKSIWPLFDVVSSPLPKEVPRKYTGRFEDFVRNPEELARPLLIDCRTIPIAAEVRFKRETSLSLVVLHTDVGPFVFKVNTEHISEAEVEEWKRVYGWDEVRAAELSITDSTLAVIDVFETIRNLDYEYPDLVGRYLVKENELEKLREEYNDLTLLAFYLPFVVKVGHLI